jgi:DNA-binding winged helix-turn-helix (wHTH) protein/tetratricopeptide (TPR) repeat protein
MSLENSPNFLLNFSEVEMNGSGEKHFYQFKSFRLNVEERQLLRNESLVSLTPKAFDVLAVLVEQHGHLVEKDELLRTVWADSFVEEANIPRVIHTLRKVLSDDGNGNKFIETVAKKGYRFVAEVTEVSCDAETTDAEKLPRPRVAASPRLIFFAVCFLTAAFLLVLLSFNLQSDSATNPGKIKSIAVLPVKPIGAGVRDEIYELGIAESLITKLGLLKGFVVRPIGATRKYSDIEQDPLAAGREQKTDYVLAANYQIAEGKIRITAQLYNVSSGQIEETYKSEKDAGNIFALQDAVADEVGNLLKTRFATTTGDSMAKRGTNNEEAYRLYLQGKNMMMKRNRTDFKKSIEYFEQAIRLDPNYASAYAGLAGASIGAEISNVNAGRDAAEKAQSAEKIKETLAKSLQLDTNLAEAYAVRGQLDFLHDWNLDGAEKNLLRAIELEPNNDHAHWLYSLVLAYRGRFDEAIKKVETAQAIYPGALMYMRDRGRYLYYARRYDEAIEQLNRVIDLDEDFVTAYGWLWRSYELTGDTDAAYRTFIKHRQKTRPDRAEIFQKAYESGGWQAVRRKQLEINKTAANNGDAYFEMARLSAVLGEKDEAFEFLNKAIEQRDWQMIMLNVEPTLDSLRGDPRFDELVRRVGF